MGEPETTDDDDIEPPTEWITLLDEMLDFCRRAGKVIRISSDGWTVEDETWTPDDDMSKLIDELYEH